MNRYVIERRDDGTFSLIESDDQGNVWPMTVKRSAREVVARLSQLLGIGPVAPQMTPETVLLGEDAEDAPPVESLLALAEAVHASDCAVHNGPALPVGPCTCGAVPPPAPAPAPEGKP